VTYARVLAEGRVRPETVEDLWEMQKNSVDIPRGLTEAVSANRLAQWIDSLAPTDIGYTNLSAGYARYRRITRAGGWPAFRQGGTIEPGASDNRIPALVARLVAEGDLGAAAGERLKGNLAYGSELQQAVRSFQTRHGLGADGRIGPGTQRSLGATAEDRARQIALNLERRRWLKRDLNPERIEVNTAAAIMVYWKDGKPVHSNRVVVGSVENQTPSLEKPFASVVANPPWTVPMGIARREILPKGPGYLAAHDMYINKDGWVVQRAGPQSSLGYVKFELRDSYAIFLHDTPSKAAFNLAMRQRSHGCVRVQGAVDFARLLLAPDPEKLAEFDAAQDSRETTRIQTGREIGVRLLYWTAFVDGQGRVAFREDVYKRDAKLADALGIAVNLPQVIADAPIDPDEVTP
jgi:murein L,D-transpeptidase YcbB/YkuD